ncbi:hypothetical protein DPMN_141475 [Dreissena polymorpha]|uniref:Uncharacterized protein n=1 Tax=Dreissena polymorpha TaxID=45954 RepID=A0A9D4GA18_DREPO|nr:hypothetical protein DPMN_141475 [Dreissena polymorpha]
MIHCSPAHDGPHNGLSFRLTYAAPLGEYLTSNITEIIANSAPHEKLGNYEVLDVGDLR